MQSRIAALLCAILCVLGAACAGTGTSRGERPDGPAWATLKVVSETPVRYATEFSITQYENGYELIEIPATGKLLLVPEGQGKPAGLSEDISVLYRPIDRIYLAATSTMEFFASARSGCPAPKRTAGQFWRRGRRWSAAICGSRASTARRTTS